MLRHKAVKPDRSIFRVEPRKNPAAIMAMTGRTTLVKAENMLDNLRVYTLQETRKSESVDPGRFELSYGFILIRIPSVRRCGRTVIVSGKVPIGSGGRS